MRKSGTGAPFTVTGSYVFTAATEPREDGSGRQRVELTPRHTAGLVAVWVSFVVVFMGARLVVLLHRARGDAWLVTGA